MMGARQRAQSGLSCEVSIEVLVPSGPAGIRDYLFLDLLDLRSLFPYSHSENASAQRITGRKQEVAVLAPVKKVL